MIETPISLLTYLRAIAEYQTSLTYYTTSDLYVEEVNEDRTLHTFPVNGYYYCNHIDNSNYYNGDSEVKKDIRGVYYGDSNTHPIIDNSDGVLTIRVNNHLYIMSEEDLNVDLPIGSNESVRWDGISTDAVMSIID